jgi:hypothetical protein
MQTLREYCAQNACGLDDGGFADDEGFPKRTRQRAKAPKPNAPRQHKLKKDGGQAALDDVRQAVDRMGATTRSGRRVLLTAKALTATGQRHSGAYRPREEDGGGLGYRSESRTEGELRIASRWSKRTCVCVRKGRDRGLRTTAPNFHQVESKWMGEMMSMGSIVMAFCHASNATQCLDDTRHTAMHGPARPLPMGIVRHDGLDVRPRVTINRTPRLRIETLNQVV